MNRKSDNQKSHPALLGGLAFTAASLILNTFWILFFRIAHVYDIIHVFPIVFLFEGLGLSPGSQFALLPIALVLDFIIGLLVGAVWGKLAKSRTSYFLGIGLTFLVYFILICYQWLPII